MCPLFRVLRSTTATLLFAALCSSGSPQLLAQGSPPESTSNWMAPANDPDSRDDLASTPRAAVRMSHGHRTRNPSQGWWISFDGCGFTTRPDDGTWTWGLELVSYGFAQSQCNTREPLSGWARGSQFAYEWDGCLQEWWVNDALGLEHGFVLRERPPNARGDLLEVHLALRGELSAKVLPGRRAIAFVDTHGTEVLTYSGLTVFDARGHDLPAWFESDGAALAIRIDERGARYPLTIDPIAQQAYLKASNTGINDNFGWSVSMSGDTIAVGAPAEASASSGTSGNQADDSAPYAGAVYVFVRNGSSWSQQAYLKASNTNAGDFFGGSLSLSGDLLVVGAPLESSASPGVGGNELDNSASAAGAAYVFVRNGTTWTQDAYLKASNPGADDRFGASVAISGTTILVGAPLEDSGATTIGGNQLDESAPQAGAVYVFRHLGSTWSQEAYFKATNSYAGLEFGRTVAIDGDRAVVGAPNEFGASTGVNGNQADLTAPLAGAAYVFLRVGSAWTQQAYLKASNTDSGDGFGGSVSVSADTIVVGASYEDSTATGVNGNQSDNSVGDSGAAYVFAWNGTWSQQAYLKASNTGASDNFGHSLSIAGDALVVGAPDEEGSDTGVNGNQLSNGAIWSGAAYLFRRNVSVWNPFAYLKASNTDAGDNFGWTIGLSGNSVTIGCPYEDSNAIGIGGNGLNNTGFDSGAVYVFTIDLSPGSFCLGDGSATACPCGNPGSPGRGCGSSAFGGGALLSASGYAGASSGTDTLVLTATDIPGPGLFFQSNGLAGAPVPFGDGLLCATVGIIRLGVVFPTAGVASYPGGLTPNAIHFGGAPISAGDTKHYQCWYRTVPGLCGADNYDLTQGLSIPWSP